MRRNLRLDFSKIKSPIPGWKLDFSEKKHAAHFAIRLFISAEWFRILRQHSTTLGIGFAIRNCNPQPPGMVFCLRKTNSKTSGMVFPAQNPIPQTWEVLSQGGKISPQDQTMLSILRNAYKLSSNSFTVSATMSLCVMRTTHYLKQHGHKLSINRRGRYMLRRLMLILGQQVLVAILTHIYSINSVLGILP